MAATGQHVPAWKRLGLTLKHAKDIPGSTQSSLVESPVTNKRSHEDGELSHDTKKRKLGAVPDVSTPSKGTTSARLSPEKQIPSSIKKSPTKPSNRPKSVSFSQDTKTEDGDTGMNAFRDWVAQQNALEIEAEEYAARERANATPDQPKQAAPVAASPKKDNASQDAPTATKEAEKPAKVKKAKSEKAKTTITSEQAQKKVKVRTPKTENKPAPEYVRYLEQHHNDRSNWKFNKSKQNDLLKNVWHIYRIPSELDDALVDYITGLQGAARQRLQDSARTVITETVQFIRKEIPEAKADPMDTIKARRAALEAAEKRELDRLSALGLLGKDEDRVQALRQKQKEDERATRLLTALIGEALGEMSGADKTPSESETATARSRKKKRKSRTVASASDSSSDDSDSDDAGRLKKKPKTTKPKTKTDSSDSESDSSDSSSSSDSDSDSSSDSEASSESDESSDDSSSSDSDDGASDSDSD